jgi:hypothetical protein
MNASRKVFRASTNTVKKIYSFGEKSVQGHLIEGSIILILIVLTAVVLKFLPLKFLCFFNNIIVKVIFLIVIAFVALYCPAIGLMLAILLVSIIQMCQRKQLSMEISNIQDSSSENKNTQPDMNVLESLTERQTNMGISSNRNRDEMDFDEIDRNADDQMPGDISGDMFESYQNQGSSMEPQGFNDDTSCMTGCGGSGSGGKQDNRRELNGMCGNVKTWSNQISAQGLDGDIVGLQSSIGYPL